MRTDLLDLTESTLERIWDGTSTHNSRSVSSTSTRSTRSTMLNSMMFLMCFVQKAGQIGFPVVLKGTQSRHCISTTISGQPCVGPLPPIVGIPLAVLPIRTKKIHPGSPTLTFHWLSVADNHFLAEPRYLFAGRHDAALQMLELLFNHNLCS